MYVHLYQNESPVAYSHNGKPHAIEEKGELLPQQHGCISVWSQRALAGHFHMKFKCRRNAQQWWG